MSIPSSGTEPTHVIVAHFDLRKTKDGKPFALMKLGRGRKHNYILQDAVCWEVNPGAGLPGTGDVIEVEYRAEEYQGRSQWKVFAMRVVDGARREALLAEFAPPDAIDREFYEESLRALIEQIPPERVCGKLVRGIFEEPAFFEAFRGQPAAKVHHQNYPGGLLEHTINVTTLALSLADAYGAQGGGGLTFNRFRMPLDRPLLIAAGLLHDIGKVYTYRFTPLPETTETNVWEGHLALSYALVRERARPFLDAPPYAGALDELNKLLHCILAHHGALEYGSPVLAACAEAFLLSQADMTDARMADIAEAGQAARVLNPEERWVGKQFHFPGGIFIGDWPEKP